MDAQGGNRYLCRNFGRENNSSNIRHFLLIVHANPLLARRPRLENSALTFLVSSSWNIEIFADMHHQINVLLIVTSSQVPLAESLSQKTIFAQ